MKNNPRKTIGVVIKKDQTYDIVKRTVKGLDEVILETFPWLIGCNYDDMVEYFEGDKAYSFIESNFEDKLDIKQESYHICDDCQTGDKTVKRCWCPYQKDVHNKKVRAYLCRGCYEDRNP